MSDLPPPLTPPGCDLTNFPFMPLDVSRLRRSKAWLVAKRNPALAFYMINLWTASWHDHPAASLEDDDDVLADLAMCDPHKWSKIRDDVMRGWVKCSDGRLYHPVVAEKAIEAWDSKLDQRWRTECGRIKKHNDRHGTNLSRPTFEEWTDSGCPSGQRLPVPWDNSETSEGQSRETHSNRKGEGQGHRQGQGQGLVNPVPIGTGGEPPDESDRPAKTPAEMTKDDLWAVGKSLLVQSGMPAKQCGAFVGKLVKDYDEAIVIEAVRAAVLKRPADPASFLKAACMARKGEGGKTLIPWHATDAGVIAKGAEIGLAPHPGEAGIQFKARVIAAVDNGGKPPEQKPTRLAIASEPARVEMSPDLAEQRSAALKSALKKSTG
jgi:hypothetical protein